MLVKLRVWHSLRYIASACALYTSYKGRPRVYMEYSLNGERTIGFKENISHVDALYDCKFYSTFEIRIHARYSHTSTYEARTLIDIFI